MGVGRIFPGPLGDFYKIILGGKETACLHAKALGQRKPPMAFAPLGMLLLSRRM